MGAWFCAWLGLFCVAPAPVPMGASASLSGVDYGIGQMLNPKIEQRLDVAIESEGFDGTMICEGSLMPDGVNDAECLFSDGEYTFVSAVFAGRNERRKYRLVAPPGMTYVQIRVLSYAGGSARVTTCAGCPDDWPWGVPK